MREINKNLNEDFMDDAGKFAKEWGHVALDATAVISSFFPGVGSVISITADLGNATWYYEEGHEFIAGLYCIMAIPFVGDIVAFPIHALLKLPTKAFLKIPGAKQGIEKLIEMSPMISKALVKMSGEKATAGVAKCGKETLHAIEVAGQKGTYDAISIIDKSLKADLKGVKLTAEGGLDIITKATAKGIVRAGNIVVRSGVKSSTNGDTNPDIKPDGGGKGGGGGSKQCPDNKLRKGCKGENVKAMQHRLLSLGYKLPRKGEDGWFGPETRAAVIKFQKDNGLKVDGIVGPNTLEKMKNGSSKKEPKKIGSSGIGADDSKLSGQDIKPTPEDKESFNTAKEKFNKQKTQAQKDKEEDEKTDSLFKESKTNKLSTKRNEKLEKLLFERFITDANRL